jgi:hypothetical protein
MLGELLGRRGTGFTLDRIDVEQAGDQGVRMLTFAALKGATTAHFAAGDGSVGVVTDLVDNQQPVATTVPADVEIDLVVLRKDDGTAVGLAQCPETWTPVG